MQKKVISLVAVLVFVFFAAAALTAQQAFIRDFTGKVEIQEPGGAWTAAYIDMPVSLGAAISTGFRSTAVIELRDARLQVAQLTRMEIEDIAAEQGTVTTSVYLKVGKIQAQVKTGENLTHDFKLRSPVSTAAVRGTSFAYDGDTCTVIEGVVTFFNLLGERRDLITGQESGTGGLDPLSDPEDAYASRAGVPPGLLGIPFETVGGYDGTAIITVNWE